MSKRNRTPEKQVTTLDEDEDNDDVVCLSESPCRKKTALGRSGSLLTTGWRLGDVVDYIFYMVWVCEIPVHVDYIATLVGRACVPLPGDDDAEACHTAAPSSKTLVGGEAVVQDTLARQQCARRLRSAHTVLQEVHRKIIEVESLLSTRGLTDDKVRTRSSVRLLRSTEVLCDHVMKTGAVEVSVSEADVIAVSGAASDEAAHSTAVYYTALENAQLFRSVSQKGGGSGPPLLVPRLPPNGAPSAKQEEVECVSVEAEVDAPSQGPLDVLFKRASQRTTSATPNKKPSPSSIVYVSADDIEIIE